jgi:hypothetical protein
MEKERGEFSCKTFPVAILERQQGAAAWAQDCCSSPAVASPEQPQALCLGSNSQAHGVAAAAARPDVLATVGRPMLLCM